MISFGLCPCWGCWFFRGLTQKNCTFAPSLAIWMKEDQKAASKSKWKERKAKYPNKLQHWFEDDISNFVSRKILVVLICILPFISVYYTGWQSNITYTWNRRRLNLMCLLTTNMFQALRTTLNFGMTINLPRAGVRAREYPRRLACHCNFARPIMLRRTWEQTYVRQI